MPIVYAYLDSLSRCGSVRECPANPVMVGSSPSRAAAAARAAAHALALEAARPVNLGIIIAYLIQINLRNGKYCWSYFLD